MSHQMGRLKLRRKLLFIGFIVISFALIMNTFNVSAVDTYYSSFSPAKDSRITLSNPKISVYVTSPNELDSTTATLEINDKVYPASFTYKGKWVYYGGYIFYSILSKNEGTISCDATNLKDGENTVEVSIKDKSNNTLSDSWKFTVAEPPKIDSLTPADTSEQKEVNELSAIISDNTAVNWDTVKLKINNNDISPNLFSVKQDTGKITYLNKFADGSSTASIEVKDSGGLTATKTWSFISDSTGPNLTTLNDFKEGATITNGILKFTGVLTDLVDIKDNAALYLDGSQTPLTSVFKYKGYKNSYGYYIILSKKEGTITYEGPVPNGEHKLKLYAEDKLGNPTTKIWSFNVEAKPVISNETPIKYGINSLKPTISANVKSPNGSINPGSITLKIDDVDYSKNIQYDAGSGLVSFTPQNDLKNESYHKINLTVADLTGLAANREWRFYTNNYPDMSDSNASSCISCHPTSQASNRVIESVHTKYLYFSGSHSNNVCANCHNYITVPASCSQCHSDPSGNNGWQYAPHGSTASIKYNPKNYDPYFPIRVTENREQNDCIVCHQPGAKVKGYVGYETTPTRLLNNHDIPELHKTSDESCTKCHAQSLTREHARDGRTDSAGKAITCNTCHQSQDQKVIDAIKNKTTECSACHGEASHDSLHVNNDVSTNCTGGGCHSNTLTIEHKNRNLTCEACHDSQNPVVTTAIANHDKNCETCHTNPIHEKIHGDCATCHQKKGLDELKHFME